MIGFTRVQSGAQDAALASGSRCRERDDAVQPRGGAVRYRAAFHGRNPTQNLSGFDKVAFDLVVAANEEAWACRTGDATLKAMRDEAVGGRRVENDVANTQVFFARRFHSEKIAVAYERGHAGPSRGETNGAALGKELAGQANEER